LHRWYVHRRRNRHFRTVSRGERETRRNVQRKRRSRRLEIV
jgi:hypothetical protein